MESSINGSKYRDYLAAYIKYLPDDRIDAMLEKIAAAKKGLAVHMDKPGGTSLAEFEELIRTVKEKNLVFSTGYMYRHNAAINAAIEKAKSGELGKIYSVEAQMNCFHTPEKRQWLSRFHGGIFVYYLCSFGAGKAHPRGQDRFRELIQASSYFVGADAVSTLG